MICLPARLAGQEVDHRLVGDRHHEGDRLGDDQRHKRHDHAHAEIGTPGGPDIGGKLAQDREVPGTRGHQRVAPRLRQVLHGKMFTPRRAYAAKRGSVEALPPSLSSI